MEKKEKFGKNQFILMFFAFSFGMILSNLLSQHREQQPQEESEALFIYRGEDKTLEDLSETLKTQINELDVKRHELIELAAIEFHVHHYAQVHGVSIREAAKAVLPIQAVDPVQVSSFYSDNQASINKPFFEVKASIEKRYQQEAIEKAKYDLLKQLEQSGDLAYSAN